MTLKKGELQTTQDINKKFLMGQLKGDEVWALEDGSYEPNENMNQIKIKLTDLEN